MNDSVAILATCAYENGPKCVIGGALSTGCNFSYVEKTAKIKKFDAQKEGYNFPEMIIDTEWEEFGNSGQLDNIKNNMDRSVDLGSVHIGKQTQDKFVAGLYLGEHVRLLLLEVEKSGAVESDLVAIHLKNRGVFKSEYISDVLRDNPNEMNFTNTIRILHELGFSDPTDSVCMAVFRVCYVVSERAAGVLAAAIVALLRHIGQQDVLIGIAGSLYAQHPLYDRLLRQWMDKLLKGSVKYDLVTADAATAKGAALVAAMAEKLGLGD